MGESAGIQEYGVSFHSIMLKPVDQITFVIALVIGQFDRREFLLQLIQHILERERAVDPRLPGPQEIQAGTVKDRNLPHQLTISDMYFRRTSRISSKVMSSSFNDL